MLGHGRRLVTSDHILVEAWSLMRVRLGNVVADRFWQRMRAGIARLELITTSDLENAWAIRESFPDQHFSLVDLTSFAVMQRLKLTRVALFDQHFAVFRYGRSRRNAFEIVR